tara:strand:- start:7162 stop:8058 length:897 start_codon:yes stop_codon:yes gene_type:complete
MEINAGNLSGLRTSFNTIFNQHFQSVETTHGKIAMEVPSTTRENDYRWMKKLKGMSEWIGQRQIQSLSQEGFKIVNKSFENTVGVDRDDIEDDTYGVYNPLMADLGQTAAEFPDQLVWPLLNTGFVNTCFDGQYFFDTDHPVLNAAGVEQSISNFQGGVGTPWYLLDVSRAIKPFIFQKRRPPTFVANDSPDADGVFRNKEFVYGVDMRCNAGYGLWQLAYASKEDLTIDNYAAARAAMMDMKGDHDRPLRLKPMLLVVPGSLEKKARDVLIAQREANGKDNTYAGTAELLVEQLLAA